MPRVEVSGLREWRRTLRETDEALQEWKATNGRVAKFGANVARAAAPKRTGTLAASVKGTATKYTAVVSAGSAKAPYAAPIHWGWPRRNIPANPFMTRAIGHYADTIRGMYQERVDKIVDKARRGP